MGLQRRHRQTICRWMVGMLLAMQWLAVSYACPPAVPAAHVTEAQAAQPGIGRQAEMPDCHHAAAAASTTPTSTTPTSSTPDSTDTALCKAHCSAGQQAPAQPPAVDSVPHMAGWCMVMAVAPAPDVPTSARSMGVARDGAPPPGWPPLYIAHGVLRN
jgi:hypothetical protein